VTKTQIITLACAGTLGLGTSVALSACGEDRGGVEVQGGGTTGTAGATTPTTPAP
jgi:hypothetical protein